MSDRKTPDLSPFGGLEAYAARQLKKYRRPPGHVPKTIKKHVVGRPPEQNEEEFLCEAVRATKNLKKDFGYRDPLVRLVALHDEALKLLKFGSKRSFRWDKHGDSESLLSLICLIRESIDVVELSYDTATASRGGMWHSEEARQRVLAAVNKITSLERPVARFADEGDLTAAEHHARLVRGLVTTTAENLAIVVA